jgi:tetratricopeptide (TPR) repeat protein
MPRHAGAAVYVAWLVVFAAACGPTSREPVPPAPATEAVKRPAPVAVSLPDLSKVDPQLRERLEAQRTAVDALQRLAAPNSGDLAQAFGELGRLCLAADFSTQAVAYLDHARQLAPAEFRWAYYLAHAYRLMNDATRAREAMESAVSLRPADAPARTWLGRLLVDEGRPAEAMPHLEAAVRADPQSAAAPFEMGRAALAQQQFADAVAHFERALALQPAAAGIHYPLAAAYRGLKDDARAASHAKSWRQGDVAMADPLMDEVGELLRTSLDFAVRGTRALDARDWPRAVTLFREGLRTAPNDAALHLNLGTALYMLARPADALAGFETAARLSPGNARAHFNAGVVLGEYGRDDEAIGRFETAVALDPTFVDARFSLADAQRRAGRVEAALAHYRLIIDVDPSASQARFGLAMGLVRLGRYAEARTVLDDAVKAHPDQVGFTHALARVLAAAPDDAVRDGRRALVLVSGLRRSLDSPSPPLLETAAMAEAATGNFREAVTLQRAVIAAARQAGATDRLPTLEANLRRYEDRQPCRQPWDDDDPVHRPGRASGLGVGNR